MMECLCGNSKKGSFLFTVDARIKLLVCLACLAMVLTYRGFVFNLFIILACLFCCFVLKIPLKAFASRFSEPLFIIFAIVCLKLFFSGNNVLFHVNVIGINIIGYKDGLREGLFIAGRISSAVSIVALMGLSTPFGEFVSAMAWFKVPRGFTEVLMFAYRYIFVLAEDAAVIYCAQKNRLGFADIRRGLKSFGCLAGSLVLKAFEKSHNITLAMLQRGYDGNLPVRECGPLKLKDVLAAALFIISMSLVRRI